MTTSDDLEDRELCPSCGWIFECGHFQRVREDMIGETNAYRRRCVECLNIACAAFGHPVAPDEWYEKRGRCRCGRRDDLSGKAAS